MGAKKKRKGMKKNISKISRQKNTDQIAKRINKVDFPVLGLVNLGNTCFFNSVMQILSQTHCLKQSMGHHLSLNEYVVALPNDMGGEQHIVINRAKERLKSSFSTDLYHFLLSMNEMKSKSSLNPSGIFNHICKTAPRFNTYQQQDSHELLRYLLEALRNEEVTRAIILSYGVSDSFDSTNLVKSLSKDEKKAIKKYGLQAEKITTYVEDVFGGKLASSVKCKFCNKLTVIQEDILDLSLPIPSEKIVHQAMLNCALEKTSEEELSDICSQQTTTLPLEANEELCISDLKITKHSTLHHVCKEDVTLTEAHLDTNSSFDSHNISCYKDKEKEKPNTMNNNIVLKESNDLNEVMPTSICTDLSLNHAQDVGNDVDVHKSCLNTDAINESSLKTDAINESSVNTDAINESSENTDAINESSVNTDDINESSVNTDAINESGVNTDTINESSVNTDAIIIKSNLSSEIAQMIPIADNKVENDSVFNHVPELSKISTTTSMKKFFDTFSVESCLKMYSSPELLEGSEKFFCDACSQVIDCQQCITAAVEGKGPSTGSSSVFTLREAVKQLLIDKPPRVLCIQLKRFHQVRKSNILQKNNAHIKFKSLLDVAPYCSETCKNLFNYKGQIMYALYGVIVHIGSLKGGHYIAYVRVRKKAAEPVNYSEDTMPAEGSASIAGVTSEEVGSEEFTPVTSTNCDFDYSSLQNSEWYCISDLHVKNVSEEEVYQSQAYMLFYEKLIIK